MQMYCKSPIRTNNGMLALYNDQMKNKWKVDCKCWKFKQCQLASIFKFVNSWSKSSSRPKPKPNPNPTPNTNTKPKPKPQST